jgi:phosphatidylglycerol:prolipoprotein diacylglycerol transferase
LRKQTTVFLSPSHKLNFVHPYLLHAGHLTLPTFGVLAAVGLMLALGLSQYTARLSGSDPDKLWNAGLFAVIAAFVLSRLLLVIEHLSSFVRFPILLLAVPSLTATGLLLTVIATLLWLRWKHIALLPALDAWAPCATLAWFFLAAGHFFEGSDPGMPFTPDSVSLHPVAFYAGILAIALASGLLQALKRPHYPGRIAAAGLVLAGIVQFLLTFLRQPEAQTFAGLDILQIVALGMILSGTTLYLAADSLRSTKHL